MATGAVIAVVIVVAALLAAGLAGTLLLRRRRLRQRFGPEYDQLASEVGERRAQAELSERQRRVAELDIRPLSQERRAGYGREWTSLQEQFIDGPARSAEAAAALVSAVAADRGYPADDEDRLVGDLSVHHADRLDGYRRAREITSRADTAGTEELRQSLLAYRALFRDLIAPEPGAGQPARETDGDSAERETTADGDSAEERTAAEGDAAEGAATDGETDGETDADGDAPWADSGRDGRDGRAPAPAAQQE